MELHLFTQELARNIDCAIGVVALPFVLYDSLSKKADAPAMKAGLDLRRSQILAKIVAELEKGIEPFLAARGGNAGNEYIPETPPILTESAKSALTDVIRNNDVEFLELRVAKKLPSVIHSLNTKIFLLMVAVMATGFIGAFALAVVPLSTRIYAALVAVPVALVAATVSVAIIRHVKVQDAEKRILSNDPQT